MNPYYLNPWRAFLGLTGAWKLVVLAALLLLAIVCAVGYFRVTSLSKKVATLSAERDALIRDCARR